jgi:hypothetical protein
MRIKCKYAAIFITAVVVVLSANFALADDVTGDSLQADVITSVPRTMTYQGILKDGDGEPIPDSFFDVTFRLFNVESGGSQLWSQLINIGTDASGLFTAELTNLNLPFDQAYWLEMQIAGQPSPLTPRQKVNMSAYSAYADSSGSSKWSVSNSVLYTNSNWGIARGGAGNSVLGTNPQTMVNLGSNSTVGSTGQSWSYSTVGGGNSNTAYSNWTTVGGGYQNQAIAGGATVAGGTQNEASGLYAAVGGGWSNIANDENATVPGGDRNEASGRCSFAAGRRAKAEDDGSFVWADYSPNADFASTAANQFLIRATNGVGIGTNSPTDQLDVNGTIRSRTGGFKYPDGTTQASASIGNPIGAIIAWAKSFPNTPSLPSNYVECNGQVLNDAASPYNGQTIPDLNGEARFLRGGTTSGATGGSVNHDHTVTLGAVVVNQITPTGTAVGPGVYSTSASSHLPSYYRIVWIMRIK